MDGGAEAGLEPCDDDSDCDDGLACTIDTCAVGARCRHEPIDEMCPEGERCQPGTGCTMGCSIDADCNDGQFCNGEERCLGGECFEGDPPDCSDGNECTVDRCDPEVDGCRYETAPGCDGGMPDAGPPPEFDPSMHYDGEFVVAPAPSLGCGMASYSFGTVQFSTSGGELRVQADWIELTESPIPDGPNFDVTATNGSCAQYRLQGTFLNANELEATWTATMLSSCSFCPDQMDSIRGVRSE